MNTHPFTIEEYQRLKEVVIPIREFLPDNQLSFVWNSYMTLEGRRESQPCSCPSAAKYWAAAVTELKAFIKRTEENNK
jgi:hypothetical protein